MKKLKRSLILIFIVIIGVAFFSVIGFPLITILCHSWQNSALNISIIGGRNILPMKIIVIDKNELQSNTTKLRNKHDDYISIGTEDFAYPLSVDMLDLVRKVKSNVTINVTPLNNFEFPYLISNERGCIPSGPDQTNLIILIKSAPFNKESRELIRETWGRENCWTKLNVKRFFLIGNSSAYNRQIELENEQFHDIIQQSFLDDYYNNTYKLVMGFHWALHYCPTARDILFVDDDYFVHPRKVESYLQSLSDAYRERHIAGMVYLNSKPFRINAGSYGKWYVDMNDYPWESYPPYPAAGTIFLSKNLVRDIFIAMHYTLYIRFDDIFLGLVLHKLLIKPAHLRNVYSEETVSMKNLSLYQNVLTSHGFKSRQLMLKIWNNLNCTHYCLKL